MMMMFVESKEQNAREKKRNWIKNKFFKKKKKFSLPLRNLVQKFLFQDYNIFWIKEKKKKQKT